METATNATTVPRQLTAFEDYFGRVALFKTGFGGFQRLRNTANITTKVAS